MLIYIYIPFLTGPEETDIDDVDGSDMDSPMISAETVELQRPVSTLVTDLDAVRDMKDLPPPLIPPIGHLESQHTNISATMVVYMIYPVTSMNNSYVF